MWTTSYTSVRKSGRQQLFNVSICFIEIDVGEWHLRTESVRSFLAKHSLQQQRIRAIISIRQTYVASNIESELFWSGYRTLSEFVWFTLYAERDFKNLSFLSDFRR